MRSAPIKRSRTLAAVLAATLLSACAPTRDWLNALVKPGRGSTSDTEIPGAPEADAYLADLAAIASGDPARQAKIYEDSRAAAERQPDPSTNLRYALVLAAPGHPQSSAAEARTMLAELLAQSPLLTPAEIALATIQLKAVEERLILEAEARRLKANASHAERAQEQAIKQRLAAVEAENRRLRQELSTAERKLEAITSIERSTREPP